MTNKKRYLGLLLIIPLLTVTLSTAFTATPANALTPRDYSYLNDNHLTVLTGNTKVCGDHICAPGEWEKLQASLTNAQLGNQGGRNAPKAITSIPSVSTAPPLSTAAAPPANAAPVLTLSNANLPLVIPLTKGLYDGKDVFYISTDTSDSDMASTLSKYTNFPVNFASALGKAPDAALANIYVFKNGVKGSGIMGFQSEVFDAIPTDPAYSPLWKVNYVEWNDPSKATVLGSDDDISSAQTNGLVTITPTNIVVNCPIVQWGGNKDGTIPAGSMQVRSDTTLTDTTPYGGGQVLNIDTQKMQVTFVAHRGFGPDGSTIYYIVTDTVMADPAKMMGVILANKTQATFSSSASSDLFQFGNGIKGTGPMGFQAGIGSTKPGDQFYSPMWRISVISWNDPSTAAVLENSHDIATHSDQTKIMPMNMIVNCPFFSADTVFSHTK
ncbi:MAG: hypothetical protein KGI27_04960 [Thaumarchaeota archaeon]|nr:hypothetical protein [Nitrososphaerota archaeon]